MMQIRVGEVSSELQFYADLITDKPTPKVITTDELIAQLDYHGITLLAHSNNKLDDQATKLIEQRKAMMAANEFLKKRALETLFKHFAQTNLSRMVIFKGTALAYSVYPQPWLRPRTDVDFLIDFGQLNEFTNAFESLGYVKEFAIDGKYLSYQSTFSKALTNHCTIQIDLHWRINNRQILAQSFNVDELLTNAQTLSSFDAAIKIPQAVDSILIAALHRLGHHHNEERLAWLYDIHLLCEGLSAEDWQLLTNKAQDKQLAAITLDALLYCEQLFTTPTNKNAINTLQKLSHTNEPSQLFLQRNLAEWRYFWHDLAGLPGLGNKLKLISEHLIPSPSYVRQQMGTRSALLGYTKRLIRGLKRISSA